GVGREEPGYRACAGAAHRSLRRGPAAQPRVGLVLPRLPSPSSGQRGRGLAPIRAGRGGYAQRFRAMALRGRRPQRLARKARRVFVASFSGEGALLPAEHLPPWLVRRKVSGGRGPRAWLPALAASAPPHTRR